MNKEQQLMVDSFANPKQLNGIETISSDILVKTSYMYATSVFVIRQEIVITDDGGLFEIPEFYEVLENGSVSNLKVKELPIPERREFYASLKLYEK